MERKQLSLEVGKINFLFHICLRNIFFGEWGFWVWAQREGLCLTKTVRRRRCQRDGALPNEKSAAHRFQSGWALLNEKSTAVLLSEKSAAPQKIQRGKAWNHWSINNRKYHNKFVVMARYFTWPHATRPTFIPQIIPTTGNTKI